MATTATPWCGSADDKLYLQSGQFESTLKTSLSVGAVEGAPHGISWDGTNTPWSGTTDDKMYLQSGQFSATLKTSRDPAATSNVIGISWDGTATPWISDTGDKWYRQSGQFSATLKTSRIIIGESIPTGISWDGTNTPWSGSSTADKLRLQSGQFSATVKTSLTVGTVDTDPDDITWDGTNTPWVGSGDDKLYLQSGHFSATLKTSRSVTTVDTAPRGIETNDVNARLGVGGISAAITGTAGDGATEAEIVSGGLTIIITLTGDTWVASGGTFDAIRQDIIDGLDSAQSEATGWNAEVRDKQGVAGVVRTSDTVVTITLDAQAAYDITAQETITVTVPSTAVAAGTPITASPTFVITETSLGQPYWKRVGGVPFMARNAPVGGPQLWEKP